MKDSRAAHIYFDSFGVEQFNVTKVHESDHVGPRTGMWDEIQPPRCRIITFLQAEINGELFDPFQPSSLLEDWGSFFISSLF
jgi:hypothetical protein